MFHDNEHTKGKIWEADPDLGVFVILQSVEKMHAAYCTLYKMQAQFKLRPVSFHKEIKHFLDASNV